MEDVVLITPPDGEPISLADAKAQLKVDFNDEDALIAGYITAARAQIEARTRRVLLTQEWMLKLDGFPGVHPLYATQGYPEILLPKPPFKSIVSLVYTDTSTNEQTLTEQTDYGFNADPLMYGYRLDPGSETQPARLMPPWARPWPPAILVGSNVRIDFLCGYCSAAYVNIVAAALGALAGATFPGALDGERIYIAGATQNAGADAGLLAATLHVDPSGNGTITPPATIPVTGALAFVGGQIPPELLMAVKLQLAYLYTQRGDVFDVNGKLPEFAPGVDGLIGPYINRIA